MSSEPTVHHTEGDLELKIEDGRAALVIPGQLSIRFPSTDAFASFISGAIRIHTHLKETDERTGSRLRD